MIKKKLLILIVFVIIFISLIGTAIYYIIIENENDYVYPIPIFEKKEPEEIAKIIADNFNLTINKTRTEIKKPHEYLKSGYSYYFIENESFLSFALRHTDDPTSAYEFIQLERFPLPKNFSNDQDYANFSVSILRSIGIKEIPSEKIEIHPYKTSITISIHQMHNGKTISNAKTQFSYNKSSNTLNWAAIRNRYYFPKGFDPPYSENEAKEIAARKMDTDKNRMKILYYSVGGNTLYYTIGGHEFVVVNSITGHCSEIAIIG
jgi:hypothetical protein